MDAEQYVAILEQGLLQSMEESGISECDITVSFNKVMIPSTSLGEPKDGLKSRGSIFWIGLHSLQVLTPLNILGITSRDVSQLMRVLL